MADTEHSDHSRRETLLVRYVQEALARIAAGEEVEPGSLCAEHPELAAPLAEALGLSGELQDLHDAARSTDPLAGIVLSGRYRLQVRIGMGAMGVVYRGTDLELQRDVAVKILDARLFSDPVAEKRFLREAELLATLQHENVVAVFDRGRSEPGMLFLVMELLDGASLATLLAETSERDDSMAVVRRLIDGKPPEDGFLRLAVRWTAELAAGLGAAHEKGVFHRDVKPSNVIVRSDHRAVLLDFGIAARVEDGRLTATATTLGTPWYMAPEQALGVERVTPAFDVYGLCATLYHLLTDRPPFEGEAAQVLLKLQIEDPPRAVSLRPDLPKDLQAIIEKGMERDPQRRYPDMAALEADLRAFLDHRSVSVRPLSPLARRWRRVRRAPARTLAVVATVAALLFAAIAVPIWLAESERARTQEKKDLLARLPHLLAIEGDPKERLLAELTGERQATIGTLDRILELDPGDLPVRLLRAALRLDQGDHRGAADDLGVLADQTGSAYVRAVAQRYLDANADIRGTRAVNLSGLPEPAGPQDHFIAGFHALRNRHEEDYAVSAEESLRVAAAEYLPARDLYLIALLARGDTATNGTEQRKWFQQAYDESLLLAGTYKFETARTLATRGVALIVLKRYQDAIEPLRKSNELRPGRHAPVHNLGVAYRRLGKLDEAERYLAEAALLRPHFWNTPYTRAQVYRDRGDFDRAFAFAETIPTEGPRGVAWKRADLIANIALRQASQLRDADPDGAAVIAGRAVAAFDDALAAAPAKMHDLLTVRREVARAVERNDVKAAATQFMTLVSLDPLNPYQIGNLAALLPPDGLDAEAVWCLRLYFHILAQKLASGDPLFQERQKAVFNQVMKNRPR